MPLIPVDRLPDRYKVVFRNAVGARQRVFITEEEFDRPDRDAYIKQAYGPQGKDWEAYMFWFVPYIETFDTPSNDLEPGMVWEGERNRVDKRTQNRSTIPLVMWRDDQGYYHEANPDELVLTRKNGKIEKVERKIKEDKLNGR